MRQKVTLSNIKSHIRRCKRLKQRYNWLGFVENKDLTLAVEALFYMGNGLWDWVKGNQQLKELEDTIE